MNDVKKEGRNKQMILIQMSTFVVLHNNGKNLNYDYLMLLNKKSLIWEHMHLWENIKIGVSLIHNNLEN